MTFNTIALKYAFFCKKHIENDSPHILDIGAQTPTFKMKTYQNLISTIDIQNDDQRSSIERVRQGGQVNAKDVYISLGYKQYDIIDINGAYNSKMFDLNLDIETSYNFNNQYDLVINNGTGEHVFNQYSLYKNIHNLTSKGGLMLNILPFLGWTNHGFYNYHPLFFADLAASNDYELVRMTFANRDGNEIYLDNASEHILLYDQVKPHKPPTTLSKMIDASLEKLGKNVFLVTVYRKLNSDEFKTPLQGKYLKDISLINDTYASQKEGSSVAKGQINDNNKRST